jgi:hypothetical protein
MIRDDWVALNETASKSDKQVESAMTQSALFDSLFQCIKEGQSSNKPVPRIWPANEIVEAHVFLDMMQARFWENERARIVYESAAFRLGAPPGSATVFGGDTIWVTQPAIEWWRQPLGHVICKG